MQWFYQFPEKSSIKHIFVFHIMSVKQALLHLNCFMCCHSHFNLELTKMTSVMLVVIVIVKVKKDQNQKWKLQPYNFTFSNFTFHVP